MRVLVQSLLAFGLLLASLMAMSNGNFVNALITFAGAMVVAWLLLSGKTWAQWGGFDSGHGSTTPADARPAEGDGDDQAPFDPDEALSRYLEKKAAGEVEPLTALQEPGLRPARRTAFGRKAG